MTPPALLAFESPSTPRPATLDDAIELDDASAAAARALRALLRRNLEIAAHAPVPAGAVQAFEQHLTVQRLSVRGTTAAALAVDEPTAAVLAGLALGAPPPRDALSVPPLTDVGRRLVLRALRTMLAEILRAAAGRELDSELVAVRMKPHRAGSALVRMSLDVEAGAPLRFELFVGSAADL